MRPRYTKISLDTFRKWEAHVAGLPPFERRVLQVLGVCYEPVPIHAVLPLLERVGIRTDAEQAPRLIDVQEALVLLQKGDFLAEDPGRMVSCRPVAAEIATRQALAEGQYPVIRDALLRAGPPVSEVKGGLPRTFGENLLALRQALYDANFPAFHRVLNQFLPGTPPPPDGLPVFHLVANPFDPEWFGRLDPPFQLATLDQLFRAAIGHLVPLEEFFAYWEGRARGGAAADDRVAIGGAGLTAEYLLLRGRIPEGRSLAGSRSTPDCLAARGMLGFFEGRLTEALRDFQAGLALLRELPGQKKNFLYGFSGYCYLLTLLKEGSPGNVAEASSLLGQILKGSPSAVGSAYGSLAEFLSPRSARDRLPIVPIPDPGGPLLTFCHLLSRFWLERLPPKAGQILEGCLDQARAGGYRWVNEEMMSLWERISGKPRRALLHFPPEPALPEVHPPLCDVVLPQETWQLTLNELAKLVPAPTTEAPSPRTSRLVWDLAVDGDPPHLHLTLTPRQQTLSRKGSWSSGRALRYGWAANQELPEFFTEQDKRVVLALHGRERLYGRSELVLKALLALVGHPLVFDRHVPTQRIEVIRGEPELLVRSGAGGFEVRLSCDLPEFGSYFVERESPSRVKIFEVGGLHRKLARILREPVRFPEAAREQLIETVAGFSRVIPVHSDVGGKQTGVAESLPADIRLRLLLTPEGPGLRAVLMVRPLGEAGPAFHPGRGGRELFIEIEGRTRHVSRDLAAETRAAAALAATCPQLAALSGERFEVSCPTPEEALQLLLEIKELGSDLVVEWPQGKTFASVVRGEFSGFRLNFAEAGDWLTVDGKLTCDDGLVLELQQLLGMMETSAGRFIRLGEDRFLALTEQFRRRLDELAAFSETHGKGRRMHPLAALALDDLLDELPPDAGEPAWRGRLERFLAAGERSYQVPSTLTAELRDYQVTAFQWLCRMAEGGVGACLADDMGLGKTVEALALILQRGAGGPTLVVAPTSVCLNWESETLRFAPTLKPHVFGPGDRKERLRKLGPYDLVISSYGLLMQESELFTGVEWETIIMDEAQSIKNFLTRRSQAAMALRGRFRMIMTGTPIENHLGELWNLFRFINPGLLGSLDRFNRVFAVPIQKAGDKMAQIRLKKLVQTFILRRTKSQVLQELPPRTESVLRVEIPPEDAALYEALRRKAVERLSESRQAPGRQHIRILAEIMKLRRFCCHPRLVVPESTSSGAKLGILEELLQELREGRHKALIFSQFVDFLTIVRARLDLLGLSYQYLDGSTPARDRARAVDAFQGGQGDFFLISLRAGGVGLNLTAADYVIHLDPWWNPAVEDQASDRAHRIGQGRPVTIYRLVTGQTIEEKIVQLHQKKRELAEGLLDGTDLSGRISAEELLQLLRD